MSISLVREYTEAVNPPRAIHLSWPFGHSLGRPFNRAQQLTILLEMLIAVYTIKTPGTILSLPYKLDAEGYDKLMIERQDILRAIDRSWRHLT